MLLILTNSYDGTTDLLIPRLPPERVFRLNCDILHDYQIEVTQGGFSISDPSGRSVSSDQVLKLYYRKPWTSDESGEVDGNSDWQFRDHELRYVVSEMVNLLWVKGVLVLVEPYAERRCGKLLQLMVAKNYFAVPPWLCRYQRPSGHPLGDKIVKSFSGEQVAPDKVLYTTRVDASALDPAYPWFIQDYVKASTDVTVVYCRGKMFAFSLPRSFISTSPDWREYISEEQTWDIFDLPRHMQDSIKSYMAQLQLDYGRLDFLLTDKEEYFFCEVNPNGQYAWLDLEGKRGLLDSIVAEISPETPVHSIPYFKNRNTLLL